MTLCEICTKQQKREEKDENEKMENCIIINIFGGPQTSEIL